MSDLMNALDGHKTQIGAVAGLIVGLCIARGWMPTDVGQVVLAVVGVWTTGAIAHAEAKRR
jgi:uncharacterized membrane protein (Fun14 family)